MNVPRITQLPHLNCFLSVLKAATAHFYATPNCTFHVPSSVAPLWSYVRLFITIPFASHSLEKNIMYSSRNWKFHFFKVAVLCYTGAGLPTIDPNVNITISVPAGTSDHGDPKLLCTPTNWHDILVFFFANYISHAATVKAYPGEGIKDLTFAVFLAIAFPFSGIARGLEAIIRHASFYRNTNDLQTAARAGALCIVVRNEHWMCYPSDANYPNYGIETLETHPGEDTKEKRIEADQTGNTLSLVY